MTEPTTAQSDAHPVGSERNGMRAFLVIWAGQLVSLLGTGMTRFALLIWAYQETGTATTVALLGFFSLIPFVLFAPPAGIVVDRIDRRVETDLPNHFDPTTRPGDTHERPAHAPISG